MALLLISFENNNEQRTMGKSVIRGDKATRNPSFLLCWMVYEIINVFSGPGLIPAISPKLNPMPKKVSGRIIYATFLIQFLPLF